MSNRAFADEETERHRVGRRRCGQGPTSIVGGQGYFTSFRLPFVLMTFFFNYTLGS